MKHIAFMTCFVTLLLVASTYSAGSWQALPVVSSAMQTSRSALQQCADTLSAFPFLNFGTVDGMPLYAKGAPHEIFIIDCDDSNLVTITTIRFIKKGDFYKLPPCHIVPAIEDSELQALIRAATGIDDPRGFIIHPRPAPQTMPVIKFLYDDNSLLNFCIRMLQANAMFHYQLQQSSKIQQSPTRPFVFKSSHVSDTMLLREFEKISWAQIANKTVRDTINIAQLRHAYDCWHTQIRLLLNQPQEQNSILYIA